MITVCTVNYKQDELLKLNIEWTLNLNPDVQFVIAENSPFVYKSQFRNFTYCDGVSQDESRDNHLSNPDKNSHGKVRSGLHHAGALEKAIKAADTRYIVLLDADFFVLQKIVPVPEAVFGAPCHNHMLGLSYFLPATNYCLIDRDQYSEEIVLDPRKVSGEFYHWEDIIDNGLPFRQSLYRYNYATMYTCSSDECSICKELPQSLQGSIPGNKPDRKIERLFYNDILYGLHFHTRNSNFAKIQLALKEAPRQVFHKASCVSQVRN